MNNENLSTMIDTWLQFTLDNPLYAIAIAVVVFILTAILYSFRVLSLTKKLNISDKTRQNAETQCTEAQQQLQDSQAQLTRATEQLEQQQKALDIEKQRAIELAQHISERNERITATIQKLANSFDIGERPVVTADFKAEDLWQQHNKVIEQLIENLNTAQQAQTELQAFYQAEKHKVTEIENRLNSLQTQLDNQINLVSTLQSQNLTLQEQNTALQQQQLQTQQALTEALQKQQANATPLLQSEPLTSIQNAPSIAPTAMPVETSPTDDNAEKLKNLFKKPAPQPEPVAPIVEPAPVIQTVTEQATTPIEPPVIEHTQTAEQIAPISVQEDNPVTDTQAILETVQTTPEPEQPSMVKGWYQKLTNKTEPETISEPAPIVAPEPTPAESEQPSIVKGWYQKLTNKTEPETTSEPAPVATPESTSIEPEQPSMVKGWYQKITNKTELESTPKPEPVSTEPAPVVVRPEPKPTVENTETKASALKSWGKFGNKKTEVVEEEDSGIEDLADKLTEKLEKFSKWFSKKDDD